MSASSSSSNAKGQNTCRARCAFGYGCCWEARLGHEITSTIRVASDGKKKKKKKNVSRALQGDFVSLERYDQNFNATVALCLKLSNIYRLWSEESWKWECERGQGECFQHHSAVMVSGGGCPVNSPEKDAPAPVICATPFLLFFSLVSTI